MEADAVATIYAVEAVLGMLLVATPENIIKDITTDAFVVLLSHPLQKT